MLVLNEKGEYVLVDDIRPIETINPEPTEAERLKALEDTMLELLLGGTTTD